MHCHAVQTVAILLFMMHSNAAALHIHDGIPDDWFVMPPSPQFTCNPTLHYVNTFQFDIYVKAKIHACRAEEDTDLNRGNLGWIQGATESCFYYSELQLEEFTTDPYTSANDITPDNCKIDHKSEYVPCKSRDNYYCGYKRYFLENLAVNMLPETQTSIKYEYYKKPLDMSTRGVELENWDVNHPENAFDLIDNVITDDTGTSWQKLKYKVSMCVCSPVPNGYALKFDEIGQPYSEICLAGYRNVKNVDTSVCEPCPIGMFQNAPGMSYCWDCDKYNQFGSAEKPGACTRYSGSTSMLDCAFCEKDYQCTKLDPTDSSKCELTETSPTKYEHNCEACVAGKSTDSIGVEQCSVTCSTGEIHRNDACQQCEQRQCAHRTASSQECVGCEAGTYWSEIQDCETTFTPHCTMCENGKYSTNAKSTSCDNCKAGKYSNEKTCWQDVQKLQNDALIGYCAQRGTEECSVLPCRQAETSCKECPVGKISATDGASECTACAAGKSSLKHEKIWAYDEDGNANLIDVNINRLPTECLPCPAGTFENAGICVQCDKHYISEEGQTTCQKCPVGQTNNTDHSECVNCADGFFTRDELVDHHADWLEAHEANAANCVGCVTVQGNNFRLLRNPDQAAVCIPCESGQFNDEDGTTTCRSCPPCPEQHYRTNCGTNKNSIEGIKGYCKRCDAEPCADDEIKIDCKNREGHNDAKGQCVPKDLVTRSPQCPHLNRLTWTFQTLGLSGYDFTEVFGVNENQTEFQCRQPCDSTIPVVNKEDILSHQPSDLLQTTDFGVVDTGYCTTAHACNTVTCMTDSVGGEVMVCPVKIEEDDSDDIKRRKRNEAQCIGCSQCMTGEFDEAVALNPGRGCVDCGQLLCDENEVFDWTEQSPGYQCKMCAELRNVKLCQNTDMHDFDPDHYPSGLIPTVRFEGCIGKGMQSLQKMTYGTCVRDESVFTTTCPDKQYYSQFSDSTDKCVDCLPRNAELKSISYQTGSGETHQTYCQITACKKEGSTGVSKWGLLCTATCTQVDCDSDAVLLDCLLPHDYRCISTLHPLQGTSQLVNADNAHVPLHVNMLEPVQSSNRLYLSSSFENHLLTLNANLDDQFQCVWNARDVLDQDTIPGGNSRTFLADDDVQGYDRYNNQGTKACRAWPGKHWPMIPLQNSVRDPDADGFFLLNSSAVAMTYRYKGSRIKYAEKFSAHRLTGDLFLNIDIHSAAPVHFMTFVRDSDVTWVDSWEISFLARDSSVDYHGAFEMDVSVPDDTGNALQNVQPQLLQRMQQYGKHFVSRLFCKQNDANSCFQPDPLKIHEHDSSILKHYRLLRDRRHIVLRSYQPVKPEHHLGSKQACIEQSHGDDAIHHPETHSTHVFEHSTLHGITADEHVLAKRDIATQTPASVLVAMVSHVDDFTGCTANTGSITCYRTCGVSRSHDFPNKVVLDLMADSARLMVTLFDVNTLKFENLVITVNTDISTRMVLNANFKVYMHDTSVWLLCRNDDFEMHLHEYLLADQQATGREIDLKWQVIDADRLAANSILMTRRDTTETWLVLASYAAPDAEFDAKVSVRVHSAAGLVQLDRNLRISDDWSLAHIETSSFVSHAWLDDTNVLVGHDGHVYMVTFDAARIDMTRLQQHQLENHHFAVYHNGLITQTIMSSARRIPIDCNAGYKPRIETTYAKIGTFEVDNDVLCYLRCDHDSACKGIRILKNECELYGISSGDNSLADQPECVRETSDQRHFAVSFHQSGGALETKKLVVNERIARKSQGLFLTAVLQDAVMLNKRHETAVGYTIFDADNYEYDELIDDQVQDSGHDFQVTRTLMTQFLPQVHSTDDNVISLPYFPYVHEQVTANSMGLRSYTHATNDEMVFDPKVFLELHVHTRATDPWLAIVKLKCMASAHVYFGNSYFESESVCQHDYPYIIARYVDNRVKFTTRDVKTVDKRSSLEHASSEMRLLLNFETELIFLQRMPHVPGAVFNNPLAFVTAQPSVDALTQNWQLIRRVTDAIPSQVAARISNPRGMQGSVAIDNMQVVPLLNVGRIRDVHDGQMHEVETEFYVPSMSELQQLHLEAVVRGDNLDSWERIHVNVRVQTDGAECPVEMRVAHATMAHDVHLGCKTETDKHRESMCSLEVPTYFNKLSGLPFVRTLSSCDVQTVVVYFNPLAKLFTCPDLNQYYDYVRDLCIGCVARVKFCDPGQFMPGCDIFGHHDKCQDCTNQPTDNEEFAVSGSVCELKCKAGFYRRDGVCTQCAAKTTCDATERWQECTESTDGQCVPCVLPEKGVFGGNEEFVASDQGECVTRCKANHFRDLSTPPFFCRRCKTTAEVLDGRDASNFIIRNCTAFEDTKALACDEEENFYKETCDLSSSDLQKDKCGVCGGDNSTCMDCKGVIDGSSVRDRCGVCDGLNACLDCAGVPDGTADLDDCGICNGDNSCLHACGVVNYDDATFDRTGEIDLGSRTYNIGTNGGFTIVTKIYPTNESVDYETLYSIMHGTNDFRLDLGTGRFLINYTPVQEGGSGFCTILYSDMNIDIPRNTWSTIIVQYQQSTHIVTLRINGRTELFDTCQTINLPIDDVTATHNYLGRLALYNPERRFHGQIAGIYFFDRFLNDEELQYVLDGIKVDGVDQHHHSLCNVPVYDACRVRDGDGSTCQGCDGSFETPLKDIQCHKCDDTTSSNDCTCDNELCLPPSSTFVDCPKYTECSNAPCTLLQECRACEMNEIYDTSTNECAVCVAGKFANDAECTECTAGKFSQEGATACKDCPANSNSIENAAECFCNSGYYFDDKACEFCMSGKHSEWSSTAQTTSCVDCAANYYCEGDGTQKACLHNTESPAGSISIDACACVEGYGWDGDTCVACNNGKYSDSISKEDCKDCAKGRYSTHYDSVATDCEPCPISYYCTGDGSKTPCSAHMTSAEGSDSELDCNCIEGYGFYSAGCQQCTFGWYSHVVAREPCTQCNADTSPYSTTEGATSAAACIACHEFAYRKEFSVIGHDPITFHVACGHCEQGKIIDDTVDQPVADGVETCKLCEDGHMNTLIDADEHDYDGDVYNQTCDPCPPGTHMDDHTHHSIHPESDCWLCDQHTYSANAGQIQCLACPSNSGNKHDIDFMDSKSHCRCNAGYSRDYSASDDSGYCSACNNGYHKSANDWAVADDVDTVCTVCGDGTTSKATSASTACKDCLPGTYSDGSTNGICEACIPSKHSYAAATACVCDKGYFDEDPARSPCDPNWSPLGDRCVKAYTTAKNWEAAKQFCISNNAELAVPQDATDNAELNDLINDHMWIGIHDSIGVNTLADYVTTTGKTLTYENWRRNAQGARIEPNSASEDCVMMYSDYYNNEWNDATCTNAYKFVCERQACIACAAGKYKDQLGDEVSLCTDCVAGKASAARGATDITVCQDCPSGKASDQDGTAECINCHSNSSPQNPATTCTCNVGYTGPDCVGASCACTACVAGKYKSLTGDGTCTECVAGKYSAALGADTVNTCTDCSAGKWSDTSGAVSESTCQSCSKGKWSDKVGAQSESTCTACPAGKYSAETGAVTNTCTNCEAGRYAASPGAWKCTLCYGGTYQTAEGQTKCEQCSSGKFSGRLTTWLGGGTYPDECTEQIPCTMCQADCDKDVDCMEGLKCRERSGGDVDPVGQCSGSAQYSGHDYCYDDTFTDISTYQCSSCADGHVSPQGATACTDCGNGEEPNFDKSACQQCSAGKFAVAAHASCQSCPPGKYAASTGLSVCTDCEAGKANSQTGSTSASACSACSAGKYANAPTAATACESCSANEWSNPAATTCDSCVQGYEIRSGCEKCNAGYFQPSDGGTQCTACPVHEYQDSQGAASCIKCNTLGSNFGTPGAGSNECACNAGYFFTDNGGLLSCTECPYATYKYTIDRAQCSACPDSTTTSGTGSQYIQDCDLCALGYGDFSIVPGSDPSCTQCNPGFYKDTFSTGSCSECQVDKYANVAGLAMCKDCPPDSTSTWHTGDRIGCYCNAGFGGTLTESNELQFVCEQCPAGTYKNLVGQSCQSCPADSTSPVESTSKSACTCNAGYEPDINGPMSKTSTVLSCTQLYCYSACYLRDACASGSTPTTNGVICSSPDCTDTYIQNLRMEWVITSSEGFISFEMSQLDLDWDDDYIEIICGNYAYVLDTRREDFDAASAIGKKYVCDSPRTGDDYYMMVKFITDGSSSSNSGFRAEYWSDYPSNCAACAAGKFSADGQSCSDCQAGYYQKSTGQTTCDACDATANLVTDVDRTLCSCMEGYRADKTVLTCVQCEVGKYRVGLTHTEFKYSESCVTCATGYTTDSTGATTCDVCIANYEPNYIPSAASISCGGHYYHDYGHAWFWTPYNDLSEQCASATSSTYGSFVSNAVGETSYKTYLYQYYTIESDLPIQVTFSQFDLDSSAALSIRCNQYTRFGLFDKWTSYVKQCTGTDNCDTVCSDLDVGSGKYYMSLQFFTSNTNGNKFGFVAEFYGQTFDSCTSCPAGKSKPAGNTPCVQNPVMR